MKKLISVVLTLSMCTALLTGCGSTAQDTKPAAEEKMKGTEAAGADAAGTDAAETETAGAEATAPEGVQAAVGTVKLRVWAGQDDQDLIQEMCQSFMYEHPETTWEIEFGVVGESDARTRYSEDPETAADVFCIPNDQLRDMVNSAALYEITRNKEKIIAENVPGSVEAASMDGALYAYPMTADNGYFMYYDKSVFSEEDVKSLDKMMEVAKEKGKKVFMDVSNGWYIASFFLGNGGKLWIEDDRQRCDFNNANGLAAAEAIKKFTADDAFITGDDSILQGGMGTSIAAGISGTWNSAAMQEILGENYAATKLPEFTCGGKQVQMASFGGYKLIGINSLTAYPVEAMELAEYLTNEENQVKRFEARGLGPSNIKAGENQSIKADSAIAALALQSQFAFPQNDVLGGFWTPTEAFGAAMEAKDYSIPMQELLDNMVSQIEMN